MLSKLTKPWTDGNGPCFGAFSRACNCYQMRYHVIRFAFNCYQTCVHERSSNRIARAPNWLFWKCTTACSTLPTLTGTRQWACQGFPPIQIYICIFSIQIDICMSAGGHFVSLVVKFDDISGNSAKEDFPLICFLSFDLESHFDSYKLHWSFGKNLNSHPVLEIIYISRLNLLIYSFLQTLKPAIISLVIWLQPQPSCHPAIHQPLDFPALAPPVNQPGLDGPNMAHRVPMATQYGTCEPCEPSLHPQYKVSG